MEMSIHRALSELKLIDSKIEKKINNFHPVGLYQESNKKINNLISQEEFKAVAESHYDSITKLIDRKSLIKRAIVDSNAKTQVTIGDEKMSVADAITKKESIKQTLSLIDRMRSVKMSAEVDMIDNNNKIEANAIRIAEAALSKDNVKIGDDDAGDIINPYLKANRVKMFDPIDSEKKIEELESKVDTFLANVDAVLSESNAITLIEVKD